MSLHAAMVEVDDVQYRPRGGTVPYHTTLVMTAPDVDSAAITLAFSPRCAAVADAAIQHLLAAVAKSRPR